MSSPKPSSIVSHAARVGAMTIRRPRESPDRTKASWSGGRYGSRTARSGSPGGTPEGVTGRPRSASAHAGPQGRSPPPVRGPATVSRSAARLSSRPVDGSLCLGVPVTSARSAPRPRRAPTGRRGSSRWPVSVGGRSHSRSAPAAAAEAPHRSRSGIVPLEGASRPEHSPRPGTREPSPWRGLRRRRDGPVPPQGRRSPKAGTRGAVVARDQAEGDGESYPRDASGFTGSMAQGRSGLWVSPRS